MYGGALAGSTHAYLQLLLPGTLVMAAVLRGGLGGWPAVAMIDRAYGHLGR